MSLAIYIFILAVTLYCSYTDLRTYKIFNKITLPVLTGGIIYHTIFGNGIVFSLKGLIVGAIILLISITGQIGDGDAMLIMAIGAWLGWCPTLIILYVAFFAGGFCSIYLILKKGQRFYPFGPCILIGVMFIGVLKYHVF